MTASRDQRLALQLAPYVLVRDARIERRTTVAGIQWQYSRLHGWTQARGGRT